MGGMEARLMPKYITYKPLARFRKATYKNLAKLGARETVDGWELQTPAGRALISVPSCDRDTAFVVYIRFDDAPFAQFVTGEVLPCDISGRSGKWNFYYVPSDHADSVYADDAAEAFACRVGRLMAYRVTEDDLYEFNRSARNA